MTTFLQLTFQGIALGCIYALVALGFTAIYRATRVINFAQGSLLLIGAYIVAYAAVDKGVPYLLAALLGIVAVAALCVVFQVVVLRPVAGQPAFTIVMITIGLNIVLTALVTALFGSQPRGNGVGDPFGSSAINAGDIVLSWVKIWTVIVTAVLLLGFFAFDRFSRYGLAIRATAIDEEAALAVGIPVRQVVALSWGIAGGVAVIGGLFLAGFPNSLEPTTGDIALRAFPAIIIGGLESPLGAVVGGLVIGLVEELTNGYEGNISFLGHNFYTIAPYCVMILVLLVRPYGLFGSRPVERV